MDALRDVLDGLNSAQRKAVEHLPEIPLQILAGPGSGKTKVLTARIAYLILVNLVPAWSICAVTFTNKAAAEMRARLTVLIGAARIKQVKMGTFHALCARLLRAHARKVGLGEDFTIMDQDESEKLVGRLLKPHKEEMVKEKCTYTARDVHNKISFAKGKGFSAVEYTADYVLNRNAGLSLDLQSEQLPYNIRLVAGIFREYDAELRRLNALDFDDLLIFGVKLVREHNEVVHWCRHVLVDEYQDTNGMQYQLMRCIAAKHKNVTIVGDPDQSIYGWRSADITNLKNMQHDFPGTTQVLLEQNYRSTSSILKLSLAIISQDKTRVQKALHTTHAPGPQPALLGFPTAQAESLFIAAEIRRLVATSGGMLAWEDFSILLRTNALSRNIEAALQIAGVPHRVLKGKRFFERVEIKDLLAYLQLVDNAAYLPAFMRTVNTPPRQLGEKSVAQIVARAEAEGISALAVCEGICGGRMTDCKPGVRKKVAPFVAVIRALRKHAVAGMGPAELLRELVTLTDYMKHLDRDKDGEARKENVQELISFAAEAEQGLSMFDVDAVMERTQVPASGSAPAQPSDAQGQGGPGAHDVIEIVDSDDEEPRSAATWAKDKGKAIVDGARNEPAAASDASTQGTELTALKKTPLRDFLEASMLATDVLTDTDDSKNKVVLSTCHSAKGLEWPVVFIPSVVNDMYPMSRAEDYNEERRLLYVAATRAQGLLYMSHPGSQMIAGEMKSRTLSPFIALPLRNNDRLMTHSLPAIDAGDRETLASVLRRPVPDAAECARRKAEFQATSYHERLMDLVAPKQPWPEPMQMGPDDMMRLAQQPFRPMGPAPQPLIMPGFSRPQVLQAPPFAPYLPGRDVPGLSRLQNFVGGGGLLAAPPAHPAPRPSAHPPRIPPPNAVAGPSSSHSSLVPQPLRASAGSHSHSSPLAPSNTTLDLTTDDVSHASSLPHGGVSHRPVSSPVVAVAGPSRKPPQLASARVSATPPADVSWLLATDSGDDEVSAEVTISREQKAPSRARSPTRSPLAVLVDPTQVSPPSHSLPSSSKGMLAASKPARSHPKPSSGVGLAVQHRTSPSVLCSPSTPRSDNPQASIVTSLPEPARHAHRASPRQLQPPPDTAAGSDIDMNPPLASVAAQAASSKSSGPAASSSPALGTKRRLGMGHRQAGYSNKKFKPPV